MSTIICIISNVIIIILLFVYVFLAIFIVMNDKNAFL